MKTVDLKTLMGWNPCKDFPQGRIADLFGGRESVTVADIFAVDMRQDEQLWAALRECFFSPLDLETMAANFVLHVGALANHNDPTVTRAVLNATMASTKNFGMLPEDERQDRWEKGATESEKCAALSALWAATAQANTEIKREKRLKKWNKERDWQVRLVKEKAGL
jgi:hypothetical protein